VKKLRYVGEAIIGLTFDPADLADEDNGVLVLRASNVSNGRIVLNDNVFVSCEVPERLITRVGDILLCSRSGSRALIGKNAMIDEASGGLTFGTFMTVFRSVANDFLYYVFNSPLFDYQSGAFLTTTINQLTVSNLYSFEVPVPPAAERAAIANYLKRVTDRIESMVAATERAIERLQEYRSALIAGAVTGKIDVHEAVA
jgi:type I restriction enzyme S subunit